MPARTIHGLTRKNAVDRQLYSLWTNMMRRCYNPSSGKYRYYGARGVTVCDRWHDVSLFAEDIKRLLGPRPPGASLDRWPDPAGNYDPDNVRWASDVEQSHNSRRYLDGRSSHPMYRSWSMIMWRNPGAMCEQWHEFPAFAGYVAAVLGLRPEGLRFRRIDPAGLFEPGNVCWG